MDLLPLQYSGAGISRLSFSFDCRRSSLNSSVTDLFVRRINDWSGKEYEWDFMRTRVNKNGRDHNSSGMALETEELWRNALTGRFRVTRKNGIAKDPSKPPPQRILIRPEFGGGPIFTIHKHSMASAISINIQHKMENKDMKLTRFIILLGQRSVQSGHASTSSQVSTSTVVPPKAVTQIEAELEAEEEYDERSLPVRTPHSETYGTIPPGILEEILSSLKERRRIYFGSKPKRNASGAIRNQVRPYVPPWLIPTSRHQAGSARKGVATEINYHNFCDLLGFPPVPTSELKLRPRQSNLQSVEQQQVNASVMKFDDAFYMLLPLWPGSTDDASANKHPFVVPDIPLQNRQYLLVFYKPLVSKDSPMPSRGYVKEVRTLILTSFYISARIISYEELQGSGLRISDEGLPVTGPLKEAYDGMPSLYQLRGEFGLKESGVVIGYCSSRNGGTQFEKHGFLELGLCSVIEPLSYEEPSSEDVSGIDWDGPPASAHPLMPMSLFEGEDMPSELTITLTPIGLAVLEIVWAGSIALTSFVPAP